MTERQVDPGQRATPLELFFDLVFVFPSYDAEATALPTRRVLAFLAGV